MKYNSTTTNETMRERMIHENETPITEMMTVFLKLTQSNFDEKKIDLIIMRSAFHFHHHETWFQKKA